jgi:hypothetical protein
MHKILGLRLPSLFKTQTKQLLGKKFESTFQKVQLKRHVGLLDIYLLLKTKLDFKSMKIFQRIVFFNYSKENQQNLT